LTAGTWRKGSSKSGLFRRDRPEYEVLQDDTVGYGGPVGYDDTASYGDSAGYAGDAQYGVEEPYGVQWPPVPPDDAGQQDHEARHNAKHYTGRHTSRQGKTTRKRVGKVVPVAAAAAVIAAGTATAYALTSGGQPAAHLNSAMAALPDSVTSASAANAGNANAAASQPLKIAMGTASHAARAAAKPAASASHKPTPAPSATATHAAASAPAAKQAAAPAASSSAAAKPAAATLSCNLSYSMLPDNVTAIVSFLVAHGYSNNAAAGMAGNIYQESKGNPESVGSGGGGLIGWTPLPSGFVTGNVTADLQTQLSQLLTYNQGWSQYIPALNAAASPADAASIYVTDFERAGIPAASTREASATNVASACGI
jgi:hypothetical protein